LLHASSSSTIIPSAGSALPGMPGFWQRSTVRSAQHARLVLRYSCQLLGAG
jgi:hypothetical protein